MAKKEQVDIEINIRGGGFKDLIEGGKSAQDQIRSLDRSIQRMVDSTEIGSKDLTAALEDTLKIYDKVTKNATTSMGFQKEIKAIEELQKEIGKMHSMADEYSKADEDQAKQILQSYKEKASFIQKQIKDTGESLKKQSDKLNKVFVDDRKKLNKYLSQDMPAKFGQSIGKGINSALSGGDIRGVISGTLEAGGSLARGGVEKFLQVRREKKLEREAKGLPPGRMGGVVNALGNIAKVAGPLLAAVGGLAMIVKLLMDSEAQTKELNKALTDTVSLYRLGDKNLGQATQRMDELRASATNFRTNLRLGIDPKQHYEVINALNDHDVKLSDLAKHYESWGEMATGVVTDVRFAALNLGTSMQEVAGFMGKMQSIHQMTLPSVRDSLVMITEAAADSGMSTKKFFSAVTQVGDQMTLYNYRLDKTVNLLRDFSQYLDPDSAKEFVQQLTTGFKDKTPLDRMRDTLIAFGGDFKKMAKAIRETVQTQIQGLDEQHSSAIAGQLKSMGIDIGKGSPEEVAKALAGLNAEQRDVMYSAISKRFGGKTAARVSALTEDARKAYSDDPLMQVDALRNADAVAQMGFTMRKLEEARKAEGKGSIDDLSATVADKYAGVNEKQFELYKRVFRDTRADLRAQGKDFSHEAIIAELQRKSVEELEKMGLREMTQRNFAEEQVAATTSISNILKYMIYDALNRISGATSGIYRWVAKRFGSDKDATLIGIKSEVDAARENLSSLERRRQEAKDEKTAKKLDAQIVEARKDLENKERYMTNFQDNADKIWAKDGKEHKAGNLMKDEIADLTVLQNSMGYEGDLAGLRKMRAAADTAWRKLEVDEEGMYTTPAGQKLTKKDYMDLYVRNEVEKQVKEAETANKLQGKELEYSEKLQELTKEGILNSDSIAYHLDNIAKQDGISLTSKTYKDFRDSMIEALFIQKTADMLSKGGVFSPEEALTIARTMRAGTSAEDYINWAQKDREIFSVETGQKEVVPGQKLTEGQIKRLREVDTAKSMEIVPTGDAKIITSGVAPLSFKAGDMVVDRASLARTVRGRPGEFVPDLLRSAAMGGSRGGAGTVVHNTFNINGGNLNEIQSTILKTFDMIERARNGER